jgi:hypothetical protein
MSRKPATAKAQREKAGVVARVKETKSRRPYDPLKLSPKEQKEELRRLMSGPYNSKHSFVEDALKNLLYVTGSQLGCEYLGQGEFTVSGLLDVEKLAPVLLEILEGEYGPTCFRAEWPTDAPDASSPSEAGDAQTGEADDTGWQTIDTAPKDGSPFHAYAPGGKDPHVLFIKWVTWTDRNGRNYARFAYADSPYVGLTKAVTHWRPIPAPPRDAAARRVGSSGPIVRPSHGLVRANSAG